MAGFARGGGQAESLEKELLGVSPLARFPEIAFVRADKILIAGSDCAWVLPAKKSVLNGGTITDHGLNWSFLPSK
jgi:hypothetical protein